MRLSTSSSNDRLPKGNWISIWLTVGLIFVGSVVFIEYHIRKNGFNPSVVDSMQLWCKQRNLASTLGEKAIILVGASRVLLDVDLQTLAHISKRTPVQLAIDGTTHMPVLENLANDPSIVGTVIVSANVYTLGKGKPEDRSAKWLSYYDSYKKRRIEPYKKINNFIKSYLNGVLVTKLKGAKPAKVILSLAFVKPSYGNYLITNSNRSKDADYSKVQMPDFYAGRVQLHCGKKEFSKKVTTYKEFLNAYKKYISTIQPSGTDSFFSNLENLMKLTQKIEDRGGNVIFVRFPTDRLLWEFDDKKYPKNMFWNEIENRHPKSIHFKDYPETSKFHLKDGSHLDFRDKRPFTEGLMKVLSKKKLI